MPVRLLLCAFPLLLLLVLVAASSGRAEERALEFARDVQPILADRCGKCHGEKARKGGLDLSSIAGLRQGGESGESGESAIAESADESLLWIMIDSGEMPPEGQPPLTDEERQVIHRWLAAGAPANDSGKRDEKQLTQHDVLPIVLLRCTTCHGARRRDGELDLRTAAAMLAGGKSGPAIVPGDAAASLMIQRIESEACPPRNLLLRFFVKRPPASEVQILRDWITAGAPVVDVAPDVATTEPDPLITDDDRQHWAFRPLRIDADSPPSALAGERKTPSAAEPTHTNAIDAFLLAKLEEHGLTISPEADRDTLIRRAYFDLVGLPPALDEWQRWRSSADENWYEQMIDHLLASPRYGERWGRYWLDVAGYADSEGGVSADPVREVAWKYRDYVIRAFNSDKPYDRFLLEQLAGDELVDYERAEQITPEIVDNLVATGFLRMGIDETGSRTMNFVPERLGVINDAITIVGEGLMGLTLGCARCHTHKYDPLPQRDYYRFKAIFQGALDEHDWLTFKNRSLNVDVAERRKRVAQVNPPLQKRLKQLDGKLKQASDEWRLELLRQHYPQQAEADREATIQALRVADNNRTLEQRILVEKLQQVELIPDDEQPEPVLVARRAVNELETEIRDVRRQLEPSLEIRALWDRGEPSPTYLLRRGEHNRPGHLVGPGVPSVLTDGKTPFAVEPPFPGGTSKTGRRLALARWLTRPDHPLTARVMVNRIFFHHFGAGLVPTLENFGVQGERPSHPELLDWLAVEFVNRGWSIKSMHRLMMNSRAYRQASQISEAARTADPLNRWLSHMPLRRMDAETLRDSLLFVAGRLDETPGGPPDPVAVDRDGLVSVLPTESGRWRRSIYVQFRRTEIPTMLDTFDYPEMGPNCLTRSISTVVPQSLLLMNNGHVRELARALADRIRTQAGGASPSEQVEALYSLVCNRLPTDDERRLGVEGLRQLQSQLPDAPHQALVTYCHTILNSAAFLYID